MTQPQVDARRLDLVVVDLGQDCFGPDFPARKHLLDLLAWKNPRVIARARRSLRAGAGGRIGLCHRIIHRNFTFRDWPDVAASAGLVSVGTLDVMGEL